ncbi:MAG: NAD-binding protein, partial [Bacteroidales bacterium]|nr:NAD-binding protein [Bacteroidales bacterium]
MNIVIEGAGDVGSHLAKMLRADGNDITVIDNDAARLASLSSYVDAETVLGRPSTIKSLKKAGVDKADLHIAVCPYVDQEVNLMGALLAKRLGAKCVVARINHEHCLSRENRALLKEMGVDHMIYPERLAADEIIDSLNHNLSNDNMDFAHGKLKISVFKLDEASAMLDLRLSEFVEKIGAEDLLKFRIIAISRGGTTLIPKMDTKFRFGDMLFVISTVEGDDCLKRYFGQNWIKTEKVMIMGGTPMAKMLARDLDAQGVEVKIIDKDKDKCITLSEKLPDSVMVVNIDGRNTDALYEEGIASYDTFIALTDNDESNILS